MNKTFLESITSRRSIYAIGKGSDVSETAVLDLLKQATDFAPSAFNSQSQRVVLLTDKAHQKLWEITLEELRKVTPAQAFKKTEGKIASFAAGEGTILYFDETATTQKLKEAFPLYAPNFEPWAEQSNGMLQFIIWTGLENLGLGVSLQHYNPLIDSDVQKAWGISSSWRLRAEMVYGKKLAEADPRSHLPLDQRVLAFDK